MRKTRPVAEIQNEEIVGVYPSILSTEICNFDARKVQDICVGRGRNTTKGSGFRYLTPAEITKVRSRNSRGFDVPIIGKSDLSKVGF